MDFFFFGVFSFVLKTKSDLSLLLPYAPPAPPSLLLPYAPPPPPSYFIYIYQAHIFLFFLLFFFFSNYFLLQLSIILFWELVL